MKHLSLFSGIGGFDLAAEWMGWENVSHTEWNDFGKTVLKDKYPNATTHHDITKTDFSIYRGLIDIVTGGFPCQPYSVAGKRKGKEDERHLWPEMLRAIREIAPRWVVGENVRGIINWDAGVVFNEVQADLEAEGYEILPFLLPAAGVNAPHERYRTWFIAYANNKRTSSGPGEVQIENGKISERNNHAEFSDTSNEDTSNANSIAFDSITNGRGNPEDVRQPTSEQKTGRSYRRNDAKKNDTDTCGSGRKELHVSGKPGKKKQSYWQGNANPSNWENFPTQSPVCNGDDGISSRLDGITFPKWRNESIKAGGNAIVPQEVYQIFKAIEQYELLNKTL